MVDARLVVVRTLNYLRSAHLPSYVAMRLLLQSVPKASFDQAISGLVSQATIRRVPRILNLKRFKTLAGSSYSYRNYSVPSPTSALADTHAIIALQCANLLPRRDYVFSYRTPFDSRYSRSFEHFSAGYRERNISVEAALESRTNVALVADVRSFYPKVDASKAFSILQQRVGDSPNLSKRDAAIALASAKRCFATPDDKGFVGLRVGPEMSHVLADLALSDVDQELSNRYPGRYFRYVDDIVLVAESSAVNDAYKKLDEVLMRSGFTRSPEKDAVVGYEEWAEHRATGALARDSSSDEFAKLKFRIKLFLARKPDQLESLRQALADAGVYFPLNQLLQGAFDREWRGKVLYFFARGWRVALSYRFDNVSDLALHAAVCRADVMRDVDRTLRVGASFSDSSVSRKWQIQSARFAINRALYFADAAALRGIRDFSASVPELSETEAVCAALLGDYTRLVKMPGNAVTACVQLKRLRGDSDADRIVFEPLNDVIAADVAAGFAIRGFDVGGLRGELPEDIKGLMDFATGSSDAVLSRGYGAEVAAIGSNFSRNARDVAASTRFSSSEDVVLDALTLSTAYAS